MKKTLTVNLGGTVFHIDEDAYRLLDNYLRNLKLHFRKQEGAEEIVNDMEIRISELFSEKLAAGRQVITIADVEEVIARMGKPEEMEGATAEDGTPHSSGSATGTGGSGGTSSTGPSYSGGFSRRLYRNPDDKMLGGVASGVAAYFGWDVTLVRILFAVLMFVPYCPMILAYLILWIVIPEAHTAAEKLNMRGEDVTIENIGKTVTDGFERVANGVNDFVNSGKPRTFFQRMGDFLVEVFGFVLKVCLVFLAVVCSPILIVLAIILVALVIAAIAVAIGGGAALFNMLPSLDWSPIMEASPMMTLAGGISFVVVLGIPMLGLIYAILRQVFNWTPMASGLKWALLILWILAVFVCIVSMSALGWPEPFTIISSAIG